MAERIRHQFETATVEVAGTPVKATASLGIASTDAFGYELDTLMRRADMAVYAAKRPAATASWWRRRATRMSRGTVLPLRAAGS